MQRSGQGATLSYQRAFIGTAALDGLYFSQAVVPTANLVKASRTTTDPRAQHQACSLVHSLSGPKTTGATKILRQSGTLQRKVYVGSDMQDTYGCSTRTSDVDILQTTGAQLPMNSIFFRF